MIDLIESIRRTISVNNNAKKWEETNVNKDFSKNWPHMNFSKTFIASPCEFTFIQTIDSNRRVSSFCESRGFATISHKNTIKDAPNHIMYELSIGFSLLEKGARGNRNSDTSSYDIIRRRLEIIQYYWAGHGWTTISSIRRGILTQYDSCLNTLS